MASFYVGQRVRIVKADCDGMESLLGREARVTQIDNDEWDDGEPYYGLDIFPIRMDPESGDWYGVNADEIEPILDRHQPCDSDFKESLDTLLETLETVK
jgi:hypothetical protein